MWGARFISTAARPHRRGTTARTAPRIQTCPRMFVRLLRAGILVRECVVNVREEAALPGAVDFCLFHPGPHTADAGMLE